MSDAHTLHFCTLFDSGYLLKGLVMLRSLRHHCPDAHVHVLCMDEQTQSILTELELPHITCIPLASLEDEALLVAKRDRSIAEYCWTLSPCLPWSTDYHFHQTYSMKVHDLRHVARLMVVYLESHRVMN